MLDSTLGEARRQVEICNACRYCEGLCSVFPAIARQRAFSDGDLTQLANLCHNCRGCYYACQFTAPHEFDLNVPKVLAEVRQDSWQTFAYPSGLSNIFHRSGLAVAMAAIIGFALLFWLARAGLAAGDGDGFYKIISHGAMVAIFAPAFVLPLLSISISLRGYWRHIGGQPVRAGHIWAAVVSSASMKNLGGGHGDGCNFEDEDRFSNVRRWSHQAVMYGFALCFASTSAGTVLHYGFDMPAPYGMWSLPKILGVPGGLLMTVGCLALLYLKMRAEKGLSDVRVFGGETGFVVLLMVVAVSGLALWAFRESSLLTELLSLHLGAVLAFFLLTPFSKMTHGFYRFAALVRDAQVASSQSNAK